MYCFKVELSFGIEATSNKWYSVILRCLTPMLSFQIEKQDHSSNTKKTQDNL